MRLWLNKCPNCHDHLYLPDQDGKYLRCEGCDLKERIGTKANFRLLLKHFGMPEDYGPKELRQKLTPAGEIIVRSYEEADMVRGDEVMSVVDAARGLLEDEERLEELRKGGFIL